MKTNLENSKLFGVERANSPRILADNRIDYPAKQYCHRESEDIKLEAEHRKAQAITILRRHTTFC